MTTRVYITPTTARRIRTVEKQFFERHHVRLTTPQIIEMAVSYLLSNASYNVQATLAPPPRVPRLDTADPS